MAIPWMKLAQAAYGLYGGYKHLKSKSKDKSRYSTGTRYGNGQRLQDDGSYIHEAPGGLGPMDAEGRNNHMYQYGFNNLTGARDREKALYDRMLSGYGDLYDRNSNPANSQAYGTFNDFMRTGGINPADRARVEGNIGNFDEEAAFGKNMMYTGGWNDADKANFRSRGTSNVPQFFAGIKNRMESAGRANGGYNPGYTAQMSKLSRDQAQASQRATQETEGALADSIRQGQIAGSGIFNRGNSSSLGARFGLMDRESEGKRWGAGSMLGLENDMMQNQFNALGGFGNMYSSTPGESSMYLDLMGDSTRTGAGMEEADRQRSADNKQRLFQGGLTAFQLWMEYQRSKNGGASTGTAGMYRPMRG